jgi:AbrB family looped-hinge helix DNA binding protein
MITRVSTKGQVVIPAELRRRLGIGPSTMLRVLEDEGGGIRLLPLPGNWRELPARVGAGPSLTRALESERAADRAREQRRRA